ncbi:MAG: Sec-independent protein translocase TatB [Actinomycetota bacterium]|nr:Sec-independent protein translocase TatB [Actinomycetota bacterium]
MLDISVEKLFILRVVAVLVIGPTRLPEYAAKFAQLVRQVRRMAANAQEQLRERLGPEFEDVDWRKLDPRQYDPRRIIREALLADDQQHSPDPDSAAAPALSERPTTEPLRTVVAGSASSPGRARLVPDQPAPFDPDAT